MLEYEPPRKKMKPMNRRGAKARYDPKLGVWWITCIKCGLEHIDGEYRKQRNTTSGLAPYCNECHRALKQETRQRERDTRETVKHFARPIRGGGRRGGESDDA